MRGRSGARGVLKCEFPLGKGGCEVVHEVKEDCLGARRSRHTGAEDWGEEFAGVNIKVVVMRYWEGLERGVREDGVCDGRAKEGGQQEEC